MDNKSLLYKLLLPSVLFISACSSDTTTTKEATFNSSDSITSPEIKSANVPSGKFDMVISDIPFPFEILDNLYAKKVPFSQKAMSDVSNVTKYNLYNSKAMNLGIYGADLAYSVTYEEFQQMGAYIKATKRLAEELNIPLAFDQTTMDKYNKYKDNKDSLTRIVYDSYTQVDKSLKGDDRVGMAALVVAGSWLEGLYLSTKTFLDTPKTPENSSLYKVISEQKKSLLIVVKLLDEYKRDAFVSEIMSELKGIASEYNTISNDIAMNEKQLVAIHSKVQALRSKIIEGR